MNEPLVANSYVLKIRNEEKMAVIQVEKIKKKYREIKDRKVAKKLSSIYNIGLSDEDGKTIAILYVYIKKMPLMN